ncbi:MAG: DUF4421 domain-containing protein [Muribaculaceae bacterium]|nr:DUF4421 domain-containing protein [Muribaculaceae bacterium]
MKKILKAILTVIVVLTFTQQASALSFALDSIAEWGRFPRFCVDVYHWGDKFFNSYDSTYVVGTGYKFNVKLKTQSWTDLYHFNLPGDVDMIMTSDPSTTVGAYLTYLAVSAGYDINLSNLITGAERTRTRFNFGFNCSLLAVEWNYVTNDVGTTITRVGEDHNHVTTDIPFNGINTSQWSLEAYYFFNHKRYSQAAAFAFSKVQEKSQGSFYAGLSVSNQKYDFNFSDLPDRLLAIFPENWADNNYKVSCRNYGLRVGYGYNWVFARHWLFGVSESPIVGLRRGKINSSFDSNSFALSNRIGVSLVWNNGRWFAGAAAKLDSNLIYDKDHTFIAGLITAEAAIGYRFNIW